MNFCWWEILYDFVIGVVLQFHFNHCAEISNQIISVYFDFLIIKLIKFKNIEIVILI